MRRLAAICLALLAGAGWLASTASGGDSHSYEIELGNAFGLTEGGDLRVAGVKAGTITDVGISPDKTALVAVETSGPLSVLGDETTCAVDPQSLIAEYFLDCNPKGDPLPDGGRIPIERTTLTVQPDLFQDLNREPVRDRLRLLLNEFGTGLAGNGGALNEAIRRGAPALRNLDRAFAILARERRTVRAINTRGDRIVARLAERSDDVKRFITSTRDAAAASANRRQDLSRDVELLDDFLAELRPTLTQLRGVSSQGEPLFRSLSNAAGGLDSLSRRFPGFAGAGERSLRALGDASAIGRRAVRKGADEVRLVRQSSRKLRPTFAPLADFLRDLSDPRRIVEIDNRARRKCDDPTRSCWATGRKGPTGYTAIEGLLNYAYYLTGATNQFDSVGHMLHFSFYDLGAGPCGSARVPGDPDSPDFGVPAKGGGFTTDLLEAHPCVAWVGPNQPGINEDLHLPPYDPSVCPDGSYAPELCDPNASPAKASVGRGPARGGSGARKPIPAPDLPGRGSGGGSSGPASGPRAGLPDRLGEALGLGEAAQGIGDAVRKGAGRRLGLRGAAGHGLGSGADGSRYGGRQSGPPAGLNDLMDYLLG